MFGMWTYLAIHDLKERLSIEMGLFLQGNRVMGKESGKKIYLPTCFPMIELKREICSAA